MLKKIYSFLKSNIVLLKFYLYFLYFLGLLYFLSHWKITEAILAVQFPSLIASLVGILLKSIGFSVHVTGPVIQLNSFAYKIIYHCTGVFLMAIYSSAVLAYPSTIKEKTIGILTGNPILFLTNIIRLVMLGIVGYKWPRYFQPSHEYLWQGIFVVFVIFLWLIWKEKFVKSEETIPVSD